MKPHIAHIVRTASTGGMERMMALIIKGLRQRNNTKHSVILLSDESPISDELRLAADNIIRIPVAGHDPRVPFKIALFAHRLGITALHARNRAVWFDAALTKSLMPVTPLIMSYHGREDYDFPSIKERFAYQSAKKVADRFFTLSEASRDMLWSDFGIKGRIDIIKNGIDIHKFSPGVAKEKSRFTIGMVGRLAAVKNHSLMLRSFAQLVHTYKQNVQLNIAGVGVMKQHLEDMAASLSITDRVSFLGDVKDMPSFLRGLDAFVLPSHMEGYPGSLLEAQAVGLPCVATAVGGSIEALRSSGILVKPNDADSLSQALLSLAISPEHCKKFGKMARQKAERSFSSELMLDQYEKLYCNPLTAKLNF